MPAWIVAEKTAEQVAPETTRRVRWAVLGLSAPPTVFLAVAVFTAMGVGTIADPGKGCGPNGSVGASADVPPATRDAINALLPDYEVASQAAGIPTMLLASIDYRENGNAPDRSALSGEPIGTTNPDSGVVTSSKRDSLDRAAEHLKAMASSVYGVTLTRGSGGDDIKKAAMAFNRGSIYAQANASPDLSPYVVNQFDESHRDMTWPDVPGEPLAGQVEYGRLGAYTLFLRLGGSATPGCAGESDVDVVRIAEQELAAGVKEEPAGCNCSPRIDEYQGSLASLPADAKPWCASFVAWLYLQAGRPFTGGIDGGWHLAAVSQIVLWLQNNGEWMGDPRPGDPIAFRDQEHIGIIEKVDGKTITTLEGNSGDAVRRNVYPANADGGYDNQIDGWGRMKAAA